MGLINANGHLTASQQERANKLGIGYMDMIDIVLKEMNDNFAEKIKKRTHTKVTAMARNPYIVVGHGPNWKEQAIKIKDTKIPIISTDVCANELMEMGIIPQYIATIEEAPKNVKEDMFDWKLIKKHKIKVIGSIITKQWLL